MAQEQYTYRAEVLRTKRGRLHRVVRETRIATGKQRLLTDERCQKDQAVGYVTLVEAQAERAIAEADPDRLCHYCF